MHLDWILTKDGRKLVEFVSKEEYDELRELCEEIADTMTSVMHNCEFTGPESTATRLSIQLDKYKQFIESNK